ncbi:Transcriptional regulator GlxA family, contains an amidase domain and an AraC-type DNA-binding HTH domain [Marivirga sericea]|uniref:Transcriptional regulator GlxA family, contains an amidase domain and an AraC-type DNA-binding HTH domain n=1 Tax=Marivirga sericea TaxID=1028 RepID=A0A1X7I5Y0_9BACT|nr:Transcriptional regulator GlxA family, contains an amidase domain and an AraC-type DNA-binding HTH domain [Marivirga sericea]
MPPNVHLLDVNGPAHIFYEAREFGANVDLHFVSMSDKSEIESSAGLFFSKLTDFDSFELSKNDFVIVPGLEFELLSDNTFLKESKPFFDWLHLQYKNGVNICSICTGTFLLAESGILNGKECTTHWRYTSKLANKFPEINIQKDRLFVAKDNLYTSAGVSSGIDLALYIVENLFGSKLSSDIAKEAVIYFRRSEADSQLNIFLQYRNHLDSRIHNAQDYMIKHICTAFTIQDIAEKVNMSMRNLTRLFKKTTGVTIGTYLEKLKVDRALQLLSEKNKVDTVAKLCGYKNSNQLRTLLKKHKSVLPTDTSSLK